MRKLSHKSLSHLSKVPEFRMTKVVACAYSPIVTAGLCYYWDIPGSWGLRLTWPVITFQPVEPLPCLLSSPFQICKFPTFWLSAWQSAASSTAQLIQGALRTPPGLFLTHCMSLSMRNLPDFQELGSLLYLWWSDYSSMPEPCIRYTCFFFQVSYVLQTSRSLSFHPVPHIWLTASQTPLTDHESSQLSYWPCLTS